MIMKTVLGMMVAMSASVWADSHWYSEGDAELKKQAMEIRKKLTLEEKVNLTYGDFYSGGVPRLNIPELVMADGPLGVRIDSITMTIDPNAPTGKRKRKVKRDNMPERATMLPATLGLAASWDRELIYQAASVVADEMLYMRGNVLFAPGINMMRDPRAGRNFEYMGEDPFLTAEMGIQYVRGVQDKGVAACLKHYVANEMEQLRHLTSSRVDEQTLREVYVYPFERAIREANAWSVMAGNHLMNEAYAAESEQGLKQILREQIGFDGVILSDWRGSYKVLPSATATLDMTTGHCQYVYGKYLLGAVKGGAVSEAMLDGMVDRILLIYIRSGVLEPGARQKGKANVPEFRKAVQEMTSQSAVLLKNNYRLLPLKTGQKIVVTGPGAKTVISGGGSSAVNKKIERQTIFDGLAKQFGQSVVHQQQVKTVDADSDVIVYCALGPEGREGRDRSEIIVSKEQQEEIKLLGAQTDHLVVVMQTSTSADMTGWEDQTDALLVVWMGGELFGGAVADVLSGVVNPSGRLPCTFGNSIEDFPCSQLKTWPATPIGQKPLTNAGIGESSRDKAYLRSPSFFTEYKEKELIGYRWFEAKSIKPMYPFGFGLSYTEFELGGLSVLPAEGGWNVQLQVKNSGKLAGANVVQLYVTVPGEKAKKLRGFEKVRLAPGESKTVSLKLRGNDLARFDPETKKWVAKAGSYKIEVGDRGVVDLPLKSSVELEAMKTFETP
jgi:beta-glucosidase